MTEEKRIQQILEKCCLNETIDTLHFWGPAIQLSTDHGPYDKVTLRIEGTFMLKQNGETTVVEREKDRLYHLTTLAYQKISAVKVLTPNNLCLRFVSGMELEVVGDNEQFEGWQLQGHVDEDIVLVVAGPGARLTLFE